MLGLAQYTKKVVHVRNQNFLSENWDDQLLEMVSIYIGFHAILFIGLGESFSTLFQLRDIFIITLVPNSWLVDELGRLGEIRHIAYKYEEKLREILSFE